LRCIALHLHIQALQLHQWAVVNQPDAFRPTVDASKIISTLLPPTYQFAQRMVIATNYLFLTNYELIAQHSAADAQRSSISYYEQQLPILEALGILVLG
jgi:hypothetical protein